jgi:hypothetical protein
METRAWLPMLRRVQCEFQDGVVPALDKGMAAQQPPGGHTSTAKDAIAIDRFHGVFRTGRDVAARGQ